MWLPSSIIISSTGPFTSRARRSASFAGTMRSSRPFTMKIGQVMFCATPSSDSVFAFLRAASSVLQWLRTRNASRVSSGNPSQASAQLNGPPSAMQALIRLSNAAARGGYYAPRAAAFDKRIKACIALGRPFNWAEAWDGLPELTREAFRVRSHCKTDEAARKNANTLSLEGVAQNITCPIFIVNGRLDRIVPAKDAERLAREVKGPVELMMIEDGNHIATNRAYRWRSQSADWMQEQLK